jgi:hypothetical protein
MSKVNKKKKVTFSDPNEARVRYKLLITNA